MADCKDMNQISTLGIQSTLVMVLYLPITEGSVFTYNFI